MSGYWDTVISIIVFGTACISLNTGIFRVFGLHVQAGFSSVVKKTALTRDRYK